jgi:methionine synthase II (cobalamin-independent)
MPTLELNCLPTIVGSMPHKKADDACKLIAKYLKDIPCWPQLPELSPRELMTPQFSAGFPGITEHGGDLTVTKGEDWDNQLASLYDDSLKNNYKYYALTDEYAAGFSCFFEQKYSSPKAVKGQITGPLSWGLTVKDSSDKAIIYDDVLADAAARYLKLCASWQETELAKFNRNTIISVDEPAMSSYGSAYLPMSREKIIELMEEVFSGLKGVKCVHCCGNTDWSILMDTSANIISFDTYNYAQSLTIYSEAVKIFLAKGNAISWGIVPNEEKNVALETAASLKDRLEEAISPFTRHGIDHKQILRQSLITPSCSLAYLSEDAAEEALQMLVELSAKMRSRYL